MTNFDSPSHGILAGTSIQWRVQDGVANPGGITIEPFDPRQLNPASYDLRLGNRFAVYDGAVDDSMDKEGRDLEPITPMHGPDAYALDSRLEQNVTEHTIPTEGLVLRPGILYLMHTVERIATNDFVPVIDGKSSIGRLGVKVHETAGYGDPGFDGQYTLEVTVVYPVRLYAGMRIAQVRFHTLAGIPELYCGQYQGAASLGPVPSRAYRQFRDDAAMTPAPTPVKTVPHEDNVRTMLEAFLGRPEALETFRGRPEVAASMPMPDTTIHPFDDEPYTASVHQVRRLLSLMSPDERSACLDGFCLECFRDLPHGVCHCRNDE